MNLDFHYYATCLAAVTAGYTLEEAQIIAYAAQLVDDNTIRTFSNKVSFQQIPTSRELDDIIHDTKDFAIAYTDKDEHEAKEIWSYFHFLPGNTERVSYQGDLSHDSLLWKWKYDDKAKKQFKYLCMPLSQIAEDMIQLSITSTDSVQHTLPMIGLKMHVLADTWAHEGFAGLPEWHLNDVKQSMGLEEYANEKWHHIIANGVSSNSPEKYTYQINNLSSARFISPIYLGHGQLGMLPDLGYIHFRYHPIWKIHAPTEKERWQERDNPLYFLNAFKQMVAALRAIRNKTPFHHDLESEIIDPSMEGKIKEVLQTRKVDQSMEWDMLTYSLIGKHIPRYIKNEWCTLCEASDDSENSYYAQFMKAANAHCEFVRNQLINW